MQRTFSHHGRRRPEGPDAKVFRFNIPQVSCGSALMLYRALQDPIPPAKTHADRPRRTPRVAFGRSQHRRGRGHRRRPARRLAHPMPRRWISNCGWQKRPASTAFIPSYPEVGRDRMRSIQGGALSARPRTPVIIPHSPTLTASPSVPPHEGQGGRSHIDSTQLSPTVGRETTILVNPANRSLSRPAKNRHSASSVGLSRPAWSFSRE